VAGPVIQSYQLACNERGSLGFRDAVAAISAGAGKPPGRALGLYDVGVMRSLFLAILLVWAVGPLAPGATLDIYWIDVEGGAATLA